MTDGFSDVPRPSGTPDSTISTGQDSRGNATNTPRLEPGSTISSPSNGNSRAAAAQEAEQQQRREKLEAVIDRFRANELSKTRAIALVIGELGLNPAVHEPEKEQTFDLYLAAISSHEAATARSFVRGLAPSGTDPNGGRPRVGGSEHSHPRDHVVDKQINDLLDSIHTQSDASVDGDFDADDGGISNKRRKLALSDLPWYKDDIELEDPTHPSCKETRRLLDIFSTDLAQVKSSIRNSAHAPSGFPTSQWERIIRGEPVDLNVVFSNLHRTEPPKENVGRVGDTQVVFGLPEAKKKVESAGDWISAWNRVVRATRFVFRHREQELREYGEYIEGEFSAKIPSVHSRIILFDIAVRNEVQGGQRLRLTDTHKFQRLYSAIVMSDGVEGHKRAGSQSVRASGSKLSICNRFNSPAGCTTPDCKFKHACRVCQRTGHSKEQHEEKGKQ